MDREQAVKIFKALSDEKRLRIIDLLLQKEQCACVLLEHLDMTQSGLSYQMKILCESGLVEGRADGKWVHYRIKHAACRDAAKLLLAITGTKEDEKGTMRR